MEYAKLPFCLKPILISRAVLTSPLKPHLVGKCGDILMMGRRGDALRLGRPL
jgi:hypothetical protein